MCISWDPLCSRLGLANGPNGLVLRADRTKEPMEFIVGEEAAAGEGVTGRGLPFSVRSDVDEVHAHRYEMI